MDARGGDRLAPVPRRLARRLRHAERGRRAALRLYPAGAARGSRHVLHRITAEQWRKHYDPA